jgi:hypothetical protein
MAVTAVIAARFLAPTPYIYVPILFCAGESKISETGGLNQRLKPPKIFEIPRAFKMPKPSLKRQSLF